MGPDRCSSFTTTNYYVQNVAAGRFFFTDDVVEPTSTPDQADPPGKPNVFLPERERPVPMMVDGVPTRRLRGKTAVPAIRSMLDTKGADGPKKGQPLATMFFKFGGVFKPTLKWMIMDDINGSDASSWSLSTEDEQTSASSQADTPTMQSDVEVEGLRGGVLMEAPNDRVGGACPVASGMTGPAAFRGLHNNLAEYIETEYDKLDATPEEQSMWIGALAEAINMKMMVEYQLQDAQECVKPSERWRS